MPTAWSPADQNFDYALDSTDFTSFTGRAGSSNVLADLNLDGVYDTADTTIWTTVYNTGEAGGREHLIELSRQR